MRKKANAILIGLACTSILSLSTGVQSVKAESQPSLQHSQRLNDALYPFETNGENSGFFNSLLANNLVDGFISTKTTRINLEYNGYSQDFVIRDSNNNRLLHFIANKNNVPFDVDVTGLFKAGENYKVTSTKDTITIFDFHVVAGAELNMPTINKVTNKDKSITGTGVPGATLNLTISGDSYSTIVNSSGKYTISLNKSYSVKSEITLYQEKDGIKSDSITAKVVEADHLDVPKINTVTDQDTSITGTGVPEATIHLTIAGDSYSTIVNSSGKYTISLNKSYSAKSEITLYQEKNEIKSDSITTTVIKTDHLNVPKINTVTDQDTTVTGTAAPGATVHLSVNGLNFSRVASSTGDFSINIEKKYPANTPISVYQELNGVKSNTVEVYVQLTSEFIINKIKSDANNITGSTHPNAQISIRIHDEDFSGTADGNGNFNINLQGATFAVGTEVTINSVSSEGTFTKTVQIYPRDPIIGLVFAGDDEIRGTVDPGATVTITVGGEKYQTTAGATGNFRQSVNPNLIVSGATVTVSTSINGLESDPVSTTVNLNK